MKIIFKQIGLFVILNFFNLNVMAMSLLLESPAFQNNQFLSELYTCKGKNISPPLTWKDGPTDAKSYVLIMEDPDAPNGTWVHWLWFNLPGELDHLEEGSSLPNGALSGMNSWNKLGYNGPCPPQGVHRYVFQLYALDTRLTLPASANREEIINAMQSHILEQSDLTGLFE